MNKIKQIIKDRDMKITSFEQDLIDYIDVLEKALVQFRWDERKLYKIIDTVGMMYIKGDD